MTKKQRKSQPEQSEKLRYKSRYTPEPLFIHAAQYLCEYICELKARKEKKDLPFYFWELKEWKEYFRSQIHTANQLLKKYKMAAILEVLKDKKNYNTYSLRAPWLQTQFIEANNRLLLKEKELERVKKEQEAQECQIKVNTNTRPELKTGPFKGLD